ncbi:MAG: choice-of-anchor B family protein [Acidobacteriota bacterium]|nr:choice-of-anchor B family protein [Acidobacteriota bacterium]
MSAPQQTRPTTRISSPARAILTAGVVTLLATALVLAHEQEFGEALPGTGHVGDPLLPVDGQILDFAAENVAMLSWLTPEDISGGVQRANDVWGYVSPSGREYAIVGLQAGTAFIEVTDPINPKVIEIIPGAESIWRDMAVYKSYAYSVNETDGGMQIIDLSRIDRGKVRLRGNLTAGGLSRAHNISINEDSGFAYLSGSNLADGGLVAIDLANPLEPVLETGTWPFAYIHDMQVVSYTKGGNAGREIAFAFAADTGVQIIDVTNKANPFTVSTVRYPGIAYTHSGWLDRKRKFLFVNDELDELDRTVNQTTTYVLKVKDLENPRFVKAFSNGMESIDHNCMVVGKRLYEANYTTGLRVFDVTKPKKAREMAHFDTYPETDHAEFAGAWGVYAALPSGVVLISDVQRGLFVLLPPE